MASFFLEARFFQASFFPASVLLPPNLLLQSPLPPSFLRRRHSRVLPAEGRFLRSELRFPRLRRRLHARIPADAIRRAFALALALALPRGAVVPELCAPGDGRVEL